MKIKRMCCYKGHNYNLLPAILVTPKEDGFIVALKWWDFHVGVYFWKEPEQEDFMTYFNGKHGERIKEIFKEHLYPDITDEPLPTDIMYRKKC